MEIKEAILHVLDLEASSLICSQKELAMTDYAVKTYLEGIMKRFNNADFKTGTLDGSNDLFADISNEQLSFVEKSTSVAQKFYDCVVQGEEIPSGDLLYFHGEDETDQYVGIFKLNYRPAYTHFVDYVDDGMLNNIIINKTILPSITQKVEEAVLINVTKQTFDLVEKKYKFDGRKVEYFSSVLLKTEATPTVQDNIKIVKKAVKEIADKYNEEKYVSMSNIQQAVYESIEEEGKISNEKIAEMVFENNISAKAEYIERVERTNFDEDIPINVPKYEKKYSKQKLKLANGIEMIIPVEVYKNKELIEFINNPDGTISVMIKNVDEIINKF
ncbi:nucleoid-associated protein [Vagococcus sp. BWB3-3]|uniref:Nucleoid-associated protein n=1 Tax=Vagococcus allomyrinae TaxID=2794353 RepID=A0A940SXB3_9ENTE|nr:nucleoid-associated protein [Vagococcus allomyrinae]MBP1044145.1 nucleoid-associated protein [Vagococcus allomyrinae]